MTKYALNPDGTLVKVEQDPRPFALPRADHRDEGWCGCTACNRQRQAEGIAAAELARQHETAARQSRHFTRWLAELRGGVSVQPIGERPQRGCH